MRLLVRQITGVLYKEDSSSCMRWFKSAERDFADRYMNVITGRG
jgi:hypothetical protein